MSKHVLLLGVLGAAFFTSIWIVFAVFPTLPDTGIAPSDSVLHTLRYFAAINGYRNANPFMRTGPFLQLWLVCLLIAIVSDTFIKPAARAAVSAFAASLSPEVGLVACTVTQDSGWRADIRTTTSGSFQGRTTTVFVFQQPRISFLKVEMACRTPWVLDIRTRNLASQALASVGALIETGDKALDEAVLIQGDDEAAIRQWACATEVQPRILSLFQVYRITSLMTVTGSEGGPVLRAHYTRFRPRFFPLAHAVGILNDLSGLAASAEAAIAHG